MEMHDVGTGLLTLNRVSPLAATKSCVKIPYMGNTQARIARGTPGYLKASASGYHIVLGDGDHG